MSDEIIYKLIVHVAGPGFRDRIEIESADLSELEPEYIERQGLVYERYGDSENFDEVRRDYIVSRSQYQMKKRRDDDEQLDPEGLMEAPEPGLVLRERGER